MKHLNLLIKPSSGYCNIQCSYCFYNDIGDNREEANHGFMTLETLENLIKESFSIVENSITFAFQGGEPTLIGIDFYKTLHKLIRKYNKNSIQVNFAIQTNGINIDKNWINLFKNENYLVGVSLDGFKDVHDYFRIDRHGKGTFNKVYKNIKILQKNSVNFNILAVVNGNTVKNIEGIYEFFKKSKFKYLQFIPCLDKLDNKVEDYSLTSKDYGEFLDRLFNMWYEDLKSNNYVSVRFFDNLISLILKGEVESCDMNGFCSIAPVVESNGNIYPCDFYALDKYLLGNINENKILDILKSKVAYNFVKSSVKVTEKCKKCEFFNICRTGCRRHKISGENLEINRFCGSFEYFYSKNLEKLYEVSRYFGR